MEKATQEDREEFAEAVKDMDIPFGRRCDARWFIRNAPIRNAEHPNFPRAMELAKKITRYGSFDDDERYARRMGA